MRKCLHLQMLNQLNEPVRQMFVKKNIPNKKQFVFSSLSHKMIVSYSLLNKVRKTIKT